MLHFALDFAPELNFATVLYKFLAWDNWDPVALLCNRCVIPCSLCISMEWSAVLETNAYPAKVKVQNKLRIQGVY